jgi:SAM-dependent methyltransferase
MLTETGKAKPRRVKEGFFEKYCTGKGIDIGCGSDPLLGTMDKWDLSISPNMDAQWMKGVDDEAYDFVYSSHCLEDLESPQIALHHWWRILRPGGYLLLYLPHRDLFERRRFLPSAGNRNHKWFFLMDRDDHPFTLGVVPMLNRLLKNPDLIYIKKCDEGYKYYRQATPGVGPGYQIIAEGEFSIEAVIRKREPGETTLEPD